MAWPAAAAPGSHGGSPECAAWRARRRRGRGESDESLAARIRQHLARRKSVEEKKMFGGVGFLLRGNTLVGVWKDSLIAQLGPDESDLALLEPHAKGFGSTGRAMKG
jgi:hypothetical protein